jgi:hypothetical protein
VLFCINSRVLSNRILSLPSLATPEWLARLIFAASVSCQRPYAPAVSPADDALVRYCFAFGCRPALAPFKFVSGHTIRKPLVVETISRGFRNGVVRRTLPAAFEPSSSTYLRSGHTHTVLKHELRQNYMKSFPNMSLRVLWASMACDYLIRI